MKIFRLFLFIIYSLVLLIVSIPMGIISWAKLIPNYWKQFMKPKKTEPILTNEETKEALNNLINEMNKEKQMSFDAHYEQPSILYWNKWGNC